MRAKFPENEKQRLEKLREYGLLDSAPEAQFDDITTLAASIFGVPISLVTLVDRDRQWFKSKQGVETQETSRDLAFCAHAILGREVLIVPDATKDSRFRDNPLVTGPLNLRFYAGAPLVTDDGFALGTLCVLDQKPFKPNDIQLKALEALARHVVTLIDLRQRNAELETARAIIAEQQTRLVEAARLAAIGDLASGVAHEVNNPLAIIVGRADQVREDLEKAPEVDRKRLVSMVSGLERRESRAQNHRRSPVAYRKKRTEIESYRKRLER